MVIEPTALEWQVFFLKEIGTLDSNFRKSHS